MFMRLSPSSQLYFKFRATTHARCQASSRAYFAWGSLYHTFGAFCAGNSGSGQSSNNVFGQDFQQLGRIRRLWRSGSRIMDQETQKSGELSLDSAMQERKAFTLK
jgi:hypothetical protein